MIRYERKCWKDHVCTVWRKIRSKACIDSALSVLVLTMKLFLVALAALAALAAGRSLRIDELDYGFCGEYL